MARFHQNSYLFSACMCWLASRSVTAYECKGGSDKFETVIVNPQQSPEIANHVEACFKKLDIGGRGRWGCRNEHDGKCSCVSDSSYIWSYGYYFNEALSSLRRGTNRFAFIRAERFEGALYLGYSCRVQVQESPKDSHYRPDKTETIQTNGPLKDTGTWHGPYYCPKDEFAVGFDLQWQDYRGSHASWCAQRKDSGECRANPEYTVPSRDDNGVTGIKLRCGKLKQGKVSFSGSKTGRFPSQYEIDTALLSGLSNREADCTQSYVSGIRVRMQIRQGTADDAGITNVRLKCQDGQLIGGDTDYDLGVVQVEEFYFEKGDSCGNSQAVCGFKIKTEYDHHDDNTGMNDLELFCCKLNEQIEDSASCEPDIKWTNVLEVSNEGSTPQSSTYRVTIGVTKESGSKKLTSNSNTKGHEWGVGTEIEGGKEFLKIKALFDYKYSTSTTNGEENEFSKTETYQNEHSYEKQLVIPPKTKIIVQQKIGVCGTVQVKTGKFKIKEVNL